MSRRSPPGSASTDGHSEKPSAHSTSAAVPATLPMHRGDVGPAASGPAPIGPEHFCAGAGPVSGPGPGHGAGPHGGRAGGVGGGGFLLGGTRRRLRFHLRDEGDSGRRGFHPLHFFPIAFRSSSKVSAAVNILWPVVPAAIACRYSLSDTPRNHLTIFVLSYLAMVPCANMIGFAGGQLANKVPHVLGVLTETTIGSIVEIVLFNVLLTRSLYAVIQAAILGSVLATMLLCLGLCFFAGGLRRDEQTFSETVSEAGSGLLLTAGFALAVPTVFRHTVPTDLISTADLVNKTLDISRATSVLLIIAYLVYVYFQTQTHHGIYDDVFKADEAREAHGHKLNPKFTMTECIVALAVSVALVSVIALSLVEEIEFIVSERGVPDAFMGLILVPLVEKFAEHLSAIDEAYDDQMNFALSHVLGATLQTALFTGPLVVIVGWGLDRPMGLDFDLFNIAVLILAIITVGNFLRDQKSNYLEGFLCVIVYIAIAVASFNYPNPKSETGESESTTETTTDILRALI